MNRKKSRNGQFDCTDNSVIYHSCQSASNRFESLCCRAEKETFLGLPSERFWLIVLIVFLCELRESLFNYQGGSSSPFLTSRLHNFVILMFTSESDYIRGKVKRPRYPRHPARNWKLRRRNNLGKLKTRPNLPGRWSTLTGCFVVVLEQAWGRFSSKWREKRHGCKRVCIVSI